jgi:carbon monoxide dehydrogenase subunit G
VNVTGSHSLTARRDAVFAAICDPEALLEVIPGCQEIHRVDDTEYRGQLSIRLPAIVGSYETTVRLVAADAPGFGRLEGRVEGAVGSISGSASFRLTEEGDRTVVDYEGQGTVNGPLARLDSRFIEGIARSLINEGLARLDRRLQATTSDGEAQARRAELETRS